jgi:hypothetical protein
MFLCLAIAPPPQHYLRLQSSERSLQAACLLAKVASGKSIPGENRVRMALHYRHEGKNRSANGETAIRLPITIHRAAHRVIFLQR